MTLPNGLVVTYGYDKDSHVTSLTYGTAGSLMFSYDANGRRTGVSGSLATTGIPGALGPIVYNKDNSLASIGGFSVNNNLVGAVTQFNGGCLACNGTFTYDPRGHLFESSTIANGTTITQDNYYDALGRRYQTAFMTGSGNTITSYVFDGQNAVQSTNSSFSNSWLLGLDLDELYFENVDGTQSSVLKDALGSVVGLTNSSKTLTDTYSYEPYGATTHTSGSSFNGQLFAGQTDDFTNLYYMRRRYYMPALGRFLVHDPIGIAGGLNVYTYAHDDPVDLSDPTGLCTSTLYDGASAGGAAAAAAGSARGSGGDLLPNVGGSGSGGDIVEKYQNQNRGGLLLVGEAVGPNGCSQYSQECQQSGGKDAYACHAELCCRAFGDNRSANAMRGCLLGMDQLLCQQAGFLRAWCRGVAHLDCFAPGILTQNPIPAAETCLPLAPYLLVPGK